MERTQLFSVTKEASLLGVLGTVPPAVTSEPQQASQDLR
jgi:hypothetical protein